MNTPATYPGLLQPRLTAALADTPVVLIHGPRQCGKTTLARAVGDAAGYAYLSFDDDVLRASARAIPWDLSPTCRTRRCWMRCNGCRNCSRR